MNTLLDASVLIAGERGALDLNGKLAENREDEVALAAITVAEILHGLHRATKEEQKARREAFIEELLADFPVVPFDLEVARVYAFLGATLASQGISIGPHDLILAATAVATRARVATRDERSFPKIPGLQFVRW